MDAAEGNGTVGPGRLGAMSGRHQYPTTWYCLIVWTVHAAGRGKLPFWVTVVYTAGVGYSGRPGAAKYQNESRISSIRFDVTP